jgi:mannose-6-phosphate isomerase-like protein (cupin superfamily)
LDVYNKSAYPYPWQQLLQYQQPPYSYPVQWSPPWSPAQSQPSIRDYGPQPFVVNIDQAAKQNNTFRTALWTGKHFQVTLMSIGVGEDIGLEVHPTTDQFIRVEDGQGLVRMGNSRDQVDFEQMAYDGFAVMIPAGKWHNIINTGNRPLKVYVIYAPPQHPFGTVHPTKASAERHG